MTHRRTLALVAAVFAGACASSSGSNPTPADGPLIVQPGAPGQAGRTFSTEELDQVEGVTYTEADVRFMQMMIPHHAQALDMTALVRQHAVTRAVQQMGLRMEISQRDEIDLMSTWLRERGEEVEPNMHAMMDMPGMRMVDGVHLMDGMLTPAEMEELANARGEEFDRLFLEGMIRHHQGAIDMVDRLFATSGRGAGVDRLQVRRGRRCRSDDGNRAHAGSAGPDALMYGPGVRPVGRTRGRGARPRGPDAER